MKHLLFPTKPSGKYDIPKLTALQLREIHRANPCPEVKALLWEIFRLRQLVLRADQLQRALSGGCYESTTFIRDCLRRDLEGEPCVVERDGRVQEFFYGTAKPGDATAD